MKGLVYYVTLCSLVLAAGCGKEQAPASDDGQNSPRSDGSLVEVTIPCTISQEAAHPASVMSKTYLDDSNGKVYWNSGNQIKLIPATAEALSEGTVYQMTAGGTGTKVGFTGEIPEGTEEVFAVYPPKSVTFGSTYVNINLSSAQKGVKDSFDDGLVVMTATGDVTGGLTFSQATGLIRISISGSDVSQVELKASSSSQLVAGTANVYYDHSAPEATTLRNFVRLSPSEGSYFTPGTYYMTAWPGDIEGFTLTYKTSQGVKSRTTVNTLKVVRGKITTIPGSDADMDLSREVKFCLSGESPSPMTRIPNSDVFEGTFPVPATGSFTISIDGTGYGFMDYSGNGGVGLVNNVKSCMPYYSISTNGEGFTRVYSVNKSVGRMSPSGNDFWLNMAASASLYVKVDLSSDTPKYYLEKVISDDGLILSQNFDLFVWGGDYNARAAGKAPSSVSDGTEAGSDTKTYTQIGYGYFDSSSGGRGTLAPAAYLKNRDMEGWSIEYCAEMAGCIQVSASSINGSVTTPALSALTGSTALTLYVDVSHFGGNANGPIAVEILGSGTFSGGSVIVGTGSSKSLASAFESGNKVYKIVESECPKAVNADLDKPVSHFTFSISGADSDTQIKLYPYNTTPAGANRFMIFKIEARK